MAKNRYIGGKNIRINVNSCEYNSFIEKFKIKIDIYCDGIFSGDLYNTSGDLIFGSNGENYNFTETYADDNLKKFRMMRGIAAAGIVVAGAVAVAEEEKRAFIYFKNDCAHPIELSLQFKSLNTYAWETGSWSFNAGEGFSRLLLSEYPAKTNNRIIYYSAKTTDDSNMAWDDGNGGKRKYESDFLPIRLSITCN